MAERSDVYFLIFTGSLLRVGTQALNAATVPDSGTCYRPTDSLIEPQPKWCHNRLLFLEYQSNMVIHAKPHLKEPACGYVHKLQSAQTAVTLSEPGDLESTSS